MMETTSPGFLEVERQGVREEGIRRNFGGTLEELSTLVVGKD